MPVPFLSGDNDYQKTIERIIELERGRITRIETQLSEEELRLSSIRDLKTQIADVDSILTQLGGINSAFRSLKASSSAPAALEARVTTNDRRITAGHHALSIQQIATTHTIASKPLRSTPATPPITLPKGELIILIEAEPHTFTFAGGSIEAFVAALNDEPTLGQVLRASIITRRANERYILISSLTSGYQHRLRVKKDSGGILRQLGLFKTNPPIRKPLITPDPYKTIIANSGYLQTDHDGYSVTAIPPNGQLTFTPEQNIDFSIVNSLNFYFFREPLTANHDDTATEPSTPTPPKTPYITATFTYSRADDPSTRHKALIKNTDVFFNLALIDAYALSLSTEQNITLHSFTFTNTSVNARFLFSPPLLEIKRTDRDPFTPIKTLQAAQDAIISYKGLKIERPNNSVSDLIPGATLRLKQPHPDPITIGFARDETNILGSITSFISEYNELIEVLNIYLSPNLDDLGGPELNEIYNERVGMLNGNFNIIRLKRSLRSLLTQPYATSQSPQLSFFSQIGITPTFVAQNAFNINSDKIDFDKTAFLSALESFGPSINHLFSYDSNTDGLPDSGFILALQKLLNNYLARQGILTLRERNLNNTITEHREKIETEEERLDKRRTQLEQDFSEVQALQSRQESIGNWLNSLQQTGN